MPAERRGIPSHRGIVTPASHQLDCEHDPPCLTGSLHDTGGCRWVPVGGGLTRREIIRCLKRFLAREIYQRVMADFRMRRHITQAA